MERKEALEVMRKNMPTDRSLPVYEALQTLIPELRESEDERIILDILRPSWKPSEEQMEALKKVVAYFGDSWVSREQKALDSLYNDLDKLSHKEC